MQLYWLMKSKPILTADPWLGKKMKPILVAGI